MGTLLYGVCHDCREFIDLGKFYSWFRYASSDYDYNSIERENLHDYFKEGWVYRTLRLHVFIAHHKGHRLGVYSEYELEALEGEYTEVAPEPGGTESAQDSIDFTDPNAGRLIVRTKFGDIFLDVHDDGVNCFRFVDGERIDTKILGEKT